MYLTEKCPMCRGNGLISKEVKPPEKFQKSLEDVKPPKKVLDAIGKELKKRKKKDKGI